MVEQAVCCPQDFLYVQTHRGFDEPCQDIPVGFAQVLFHHYEEWGEECNERGRIAFGSWLMVHGEWL